MKSRIILILACAIAANGAPGSRLQPVLDSCRVSVDHIGGLVKVEYDAWMAMGQNAAIKAVEEAYGDRLKTFDIDGELPCGVKPIKDIMKMSEDDALRVYGMHFPAPYYL